MKQRLFSAARVGEFAGVTRQYISGLCKNQFPDAKVGTKVNINHPGIKEFLESKGVDVNAHLKAAAERTSHLAKKSVSQRETKAQVRLDKIKTDSVAGVSSTDPNEVPRPNDIPVSGYTHMTLHEISMIHGTNEEFKQWLAARKTQEEVIERELKNKQRLGEVISREFVEKNIFGLIEELMSRLLVDAPNNLVSRVYAHKEAGDSKEEAAETIRRELGKLAKATKTQVEKRMKA